MAPPKAIRFEFQPVNVAQHYFITAPDKVIAYIGGLGSGKTHVGGTWAKKKCLEWPNGDGLIAANSYRQLETATLPKFRDLLYESNIPHTYNSQAKILKIDLPGFTGVVHCRSLSEYNDLRGTAFLWAWLDETRDTRKEAFDVVIGRMRQRIASRDIEVMLGVSEKPFVVHRGTEFPSSVGPQYINPGDTVDQQIRITTTPDMMRGKWLYDYLHNGEMIADLSKKGIAITEVHSSSRENPHLPDGYVETTSAGLDPEMARQEIEGEWVIIPPGKPVYGSVFNQGIHLIDSKFNPDKELIIGMDFGYHHPAAVFCQIDNQDRLIILGEMLGTDIQLEDFCESIWSYINTHFGVGKADIKVKTYCDPAGRQKSDKSERTSFQITHEYKLNPVCKKVSILDGIAIVRRRMSKLIAGKPGIMVDRQRPCKLIEGFRGGYHYPEQQNQFKAEKIEPFKDGTYDHLMDALRYAVVNLYTVHEAKPTKRSYGDEYFAADDLTGY
jgi:phage terminase large subunit